MPDPKKQSKKNKLKKKYQDKNLKRGERRSDGSIVGGIAGPKKPTATKAKKQAATKAEKQAATKPPQKAATKAATKAKKQAANSSTSPKLKKGGAKKGEAKKGGVKKANKFETINPNTIDKTTGKKYDDSEQGRKARLKREQAAGMRDEMGYQTSTYENGPAPKNLGTVSDGTPFYKRGPLYAHEAGHIDPTKEKNKAKEKAKKNSSTANRVYGKTTKTQTTDKHGLTTYTSSTPYTQTGKGTATKSYKQLKKEGGDVKAARKWNAEHSRKGVVTRSHTSFNLKPAGIKFKPMLPTADITIPKVPKKSKPPMPTFSMSKGRSGGGTTKLIDFNNNRVKKTKSRSGNSCGCS